MEKFIMAGGTAVRISDTQAGNCPVVLLHGYLESLDVWDAFTRLLPSSLRVVALDLPGHGISEVKGEVHSMELLADTIHGVLQTLDIPAAVIVGHSMGGYAALEFLHRYPAECLGIVLFHSTPNPDTEQKKADREREIALIREGKKELIARLAPEQGFAPENRERCREAIEALSEQTFLTEDEGIVALLRGMQQREDRNQTLRNSNIPQLFILGRQDSFIPQEAAETMLAAHPQAQVCWLEQAGHMGFVEEPRKAAQELTDFVLIACRKAGIRTEETASTTVPCAEE